MPQAGTFGIGFDEVMAVATIITLLLAIIPPMTNPKGINPLEFPSAFIYSFNYLWFDNFNFFRTDAKGCVNVVNQTNIESIGPNLTVYNNTGYSANRSFIDEMLYKANLELGVWARGTPQISSTPVRTAVDVFQSGDAVGALVSTIVNTIAFAYRIIFGCGFGMIRLVIGLAIASYWFFKLIPLWQLLWSMFMALIG